MVEIQWIPERPNDAAFATRVEEAVYSAIGRDAEGVATLVAKDERRLIVPPTRLVPGPTVWDTCGERIRVDGGIIAALRLSGLLVK
jgi:hypothetical protein